MAADSVHIDCDFACRLHCVSVKTNSGLRRDFADLFNRLQNSGLVVRHHDRNELRIRAQSAPHVIGIDQATAIYWKNRDVCPNVLQMLASE
jgi:hypothetical protein